MKRDRQADGRREREMKWSEEELESVCQREKDEEGYWRARKLERKGKVNAYSTLYVIVFDFV